MNTNSSYNSSSSTSKDDARVKGCPIPEQLQVEGFKERYDEYWEYMEVTHRKRHSIGAIQAHFRKLIELQEKGDDPLKVIDQTMIAGNKSFYKLRNFQSEEQKKKEDNPNYGMTGADAFQNDYTNL